ncbi:hypothetical protein EV363DRAFT_1174912 [Boletus edulis]|nr:hypothetical protein EV363DRAFT_1174912 [Boletus edulis]
MPPQRLRRSARLRALAQPFRMTPQQAKGKASARPSDNNQPIPKPAGRTGGRGKGKGRAQDATGPLPTASSNISKPTFFLMLSFISNSLLPSLSGLSAYQLVNSPVISVPSVHPVSQLIIWSALSVLSSHQSVSQPVSQSCQSISQPGCQSISQFSLSGHQLTSWSFLSVTSVDQFPDVGQIRSDFPHYDELDEIWRGIPGFDSDLISSDPTVDHAQGLLSLVKVKSKNTPAVDTQEEGDVVGDGPDDANDGVGDNNDHGGLEGEDFLDSDDNDMQVDDNDNQRSGRLGWQDEGEATALDNAYRAPSTFSAQTAAHTAGPSGSKMSAKGAGKIRTPSWDSRSAFRQQTPYTRHPPHSVRSSISLPSTTASPGPSTAAGTAKKPTFTSAKIKNDLSDRLSEFTRETDNHLEGISDNRTRRFLAKLNHSTRDKELEMQRSQLEMEHANADIFHRRELDRMQKEIERADKGIELTNAEGRRFARQAELVQLQIRLEEMRQNNHSS